MYQLLIARMEKKKKRIVLESGPEWLLLVMMINMHILAPVLMVTYGLLIQKPKRS